MNATKLNEKQIQAYVKARYPGAIFTAAADCWQKPGRGWVLTKNEALAGAEQEVEFFQAKDGTKPSWYQ